jgi:hypothetical protein
MNEITWNIDNPNDMRIVLRQYGNIIMQISVYEVIESCSRIKVMQHVGECDRTPWLTRWQNEKHQEITDLLKKDYSDV